MIITDIQREMKYRYHPFYASNLDLMVIAHVDFCKQSDKLTKLEENFLFLIVAGYNAREMSLLLNISERSIRRRIFELRLTMLENDPR
jgi:hypothetical protein